MRQMILPTVLVTITLSVARAVRFSEHEVADMENHEGASTLTHTGADKTHTDQKERDFISQEDRGMAESRVSTNALGAYLLAHARRLETMPMTDKIIDVHGSNAGTSAEVKSQFAIPQKIHATSTFKKDCIAPYAKKNMMLDVESFSHTDDVENIEFIRKHFGEPFVEAYNKMEKGPHKADLFRYAKLYVEGGMYLDIKTLMKMPPRDVFKSGTSRYVWYTVLTQGDGHDDGHGHDYNISEGRIYNGMIATPPGNPILLELMHMIKDNPSPRLYHQYVWDFTKKIEQKTGKERLAKGIYEVGNTTLILLEEHCTKMNYPKPMFGHFSYFEVLHPRPPVQAGCTDAMTDHYNLCCQIHDSEDRLVAFTRDPAYPRGKSWEACK